MTEWLKAHPMTLIGLVVWAAGLLWLMPGSRSNSRRPQVPGLLLTAAGLVTFCLSCGRPQSEIASELMFWLFAGGALLCGVLMITARNPVYAALWFALSTLSTCGLFLLQSAPFLAAATVIVYAGAVIVTFLFVIMLAQQSGAATYDQQSRQSIPAVVSAFVLLGALCMAIQTERSIQPASDSPSASAGNPPTMAQSMAGGSKTLDPSMFDPARLSKPAGLSKPQPEQPLGSLTGLGRSVFGDYLFAVELAGTLLLVASIGAIAIAPRREQGAL